MKTFKEFIDELYKVQKGNEEETKIFDKVEKLPDRAGNDDSLFTGDIKNVRSKKRPADRKPGKL